jgi:hypothetical protein
MSLISPFFNLTKIFFITLVVRNEKKVQPINNALGEPVILLPKKCIITKNKLKRQVKASMENNIFYNPKLYR